MAKKAQNIEITPELMDRILANPLFQQKMASAMSEAKSKPQASFVDTSEIGLPQLSPEQLRQQASVLNKNINQSIAQTQLRAMG